MNDGEFHTIADQAIEDIQEAIDDSGADIDYEAVGGVLTLEFDNGSKIIFSKQAPAMQLWMAARAGGFTSTMTVKSGSGTAIAVTTKSSMRCSAGLPVIKAEIALNCHHPDFGSGSRLHSNPFNHHEQTDVYSDRFMVI